MLQQNSLYILKNNHFQPRAGAAPVGCNPDSVRNTPVDSPVLFERGTLSLLCQSLADIACSYEQMFRGCKLEHRGDGKFNIDKEQNGGLFKLCTDNFSIIKGATDAIPCLQTK